MPDAIFDHPRLARIYDAFDGERDDLDAYLDIIEALDPRSVVDVGCGTGVLALLLASRGMTVTGVDPAEASLDVARQKLGGEAVTWIHGDATALPRLGADLAVMTGNVVQVFLTDQDWAAALRAVHQALKPAGHFVFETRRPERRAWEDWAVPAEPVVLGVAGIGQVEERRVLTKVDLPFVSFRHTYRFAADGFTAASDSTLRFRSRGEVEQSLDAADFRVLELRDAPDRPGREYVFIAQRTDGTYGTDRR